MTPLLTLRRRLAAGLACALLPGLALASPSAARAPIADPAAPVPPTLYRSVFGGAPGGVEQASADWRQANAALAPAGAGHGGHMHGMPPPAPAPATAPPPAPAHPHHHH